MTITVWPPGEPETDPSASATGQDNEEPPFLARVPPRRLAAFVIVVATTLVIIWLVFAVPIAHLWYQSRQQALTGQVSNAGSTLGSLRPKTGQEVGVLQDPAIGLNVVIAQGDSPAVLRGAPGHLPASPLPGAIGNSVIFGHDKAWGGPFAKIGRLQVGDKLYLQARPGSVHLQSGQTGDFIYTVTSVATIRESDRQPLAPTNDYRLTLVTDSGGGLGSDRVEVVTAVSGTVGKVTGAVPKHSSLVPPVGSLLWNGNVGSFLIRALAALAVIVLLTRRHRGAVVVAVGAVLVLATLLPLLIVFDTIVFRPLA